MGPALVELVSVVWFLLFGQNHGLESCGNTYRNTSGSFTFPYNNSSKQYQNGITCTNIINTGSTLVSLSFEDFGTEKGYDYVKIYDANGIIRVSLTGNLGGLSLQPASYLKVVFTSDSSGTYRTFEAAWKIFALGLSTAPYTFQIKESSNLSVDCSRYTTWDTYSTTTYKWTHGGKTVSTDANLMTRNISRNQAGNYLCTASLAAGSASVSISVDVQHAPSIDGPSLYNVTEFSRLEIDCSVYTTAGSPFTSYAWTYDGATVSKWGILYRRSISRQQGGQYTCTASNTQGADSHSVTVNVQYRPSIAGLPSVHTVRETSRLRIDCSYYTIHGNPPNTSYKWTYGGSTVSTEAVLERRNIRRSEGGWYTCSVRNNISRWYSYRVRASAAVNVDVQYIDKPRLTIVEDEVKENDTVILSCEVASNPTATMAVRKSSIVRNSQHNNSVSNTIERAGCLDTGRYTCSAFNTVVGYQSDTKTLNVLCPPRHDHRKQLDSVVTSDKHQPASFKADIIANPRPNFTLYRYDGQVMPSVINGASTSYGTSMQSILQINITSDHDYGLYTVDVENSEGRARLTYTLTAASPPAAPSQVQVLAVGDTSVSLQWVSGYNGGANQTFMLQYNSETHPNWSIWRNDINDPGRGTLVKEDILSLTPAITYQFQLYGVNFYGAGDGVTINTTTSSSGKFRLAIGLGTASGGIVVSILAIGCVLLIRTSGKRKITNAPAGETRDNVYTNSVPRTHCQDDELECVYEPVETGDAEKGLYCNAAELKNGQRSYTHAEETCKSGTTDGASCRQGSESGRVYVQFEMGRKQWPEDAETNLYCNTGELTNESIYMNTL